MQSVFTYQGREVVIPAAAEVPLDFRPDGIYGGFVQVILGTVYPWIDEQQPIETMYGFPSMPLAVVELTPELRKRIRWARHTMHTARVVDLSPFVVVDEWPVTDEITIELANSPYRPVLSRAYAGDYRPPLPWQRSAKYADGGGRAFCVRYWREHAFAYRSSQVVLGSMTSSSPAWFV